MCYDSSDSISAFIDGGWAINITHMYDKVVKHEQSTLHNNSVDAFIKSLAHKDVQSLFDKEAKSKRQRDVLERRNVVHRVIDIIV